MRGEIDLHIHSDKSSDGDFSPFHIVSLAKEKGIRAIAISDHDTVAAYPEAIRLGEEAGVEVIPSIELTTLYKNREFHLLLPFVDWRKDVVSTLVEKVAKRRMEEAKERVNKLQKLGFDINWKEILKESGSFPPLGVTIASILLRKAKKTRDPGFQKYLEGKDRLIAPYAFYKDFFTEGKPAFVRHRNLSLLDVLDVVPETGGVPVLAHPGAYYQNVQREDLASLKEKGLAGLEVYTSYHNSSQEKLYRDLAGEFDLIPTAGSDFHGTIKPHVSFGGLCSGWYWMVEELQKRRPI